MEKSDEQSICEVLPPVKLAKSDEPNRDVTVHHSNTELKQKQHTMSDDEKGVNNQDICNNKRNVKTINKNDCSVVIDDDTQAKQQQQQQQQLKQQPQTYGCVHYKRKARFVVSQKKHHCGTNDLNSLQFSYEQKRDAKPSSPLFPSTHCENHFNLTNLSLLNIQYSFVRAHTQNILRERNTKRLLDHVAPLTSSSSPSSVQ